MVSWSSGYRCVAARHVKSHQLYAALVYGARRASEAVCHNCVALTRQTFSAGAPQCPGHPGGLTRQPNLKIRPPKSRTRESPAGGGRRPPAAAGSRRPAAGGRCPIGHIVGVLAAGGFAASDHSKSVRTQSIEPALPA
jgi:hypothetical protein